MTVRDKNLFEQSGPREPRNTVTFHALSRDGLRVLLLDREWHSFLSIAATVQPQLRPELVTRKYVEAPQGTGEKSQRERRDRQSMSPEQQLTEGTRMLLRSALRDLTRIGVLEKRNHELYAEYRLAEWFCWGCGARCSPTAQADPRDRETSNGLCSVCAAVVGKPQS